MSEFIGLFDDEDKDYNPIGSGFDPHNHDGSPSPAPSVFDDFVDPVGQKKEQEEEEDATKGGEDPDTKGSQKTGEEKEEETKDDKQNPWEVVEALLGEKLLEKLPDDVEHPLSEKAVIAQMKAYREQGVKSFMEELKTTAPDIFDYYDYMKNGGDPTKYFETISKVDVETIDSDGQAKSFLKREYKEKGLTDKYIDKLLSIAEEEGTLLEEAKNILNEKNAKNESNRALLLKEQEKQQKEFEKRIEHMGNVVTEKIKAGTIDKFIIPESERQDFMNYMLPNIKAFRDGSFLILKEVKEENLEQTLQEEYFRYKKGDLSKLIKNAANTKKVEDFRLNFQGESKSGKGQRPSGSRPLDQFISIF